MNPIAKAENMKIIAYAFLGLLVIGGIFAWDRHRDSMYAAELAKWQVRKQHDDSVLAVVVRERDEATLANTRSVPIYLEGKTRIIRDAAGTSAAPQVQACFELADRRISACEKSRKADSSVIVAQQAKIKTLEAKPDSRVPRYQPFAEALYDVANMVPVVRAGATGKVLGPVSLSVAGEYAAPKAGSSDPKFRALAGLRVNF